jgi:histidinol-phosphate aminotransferase
MTLTRRSFLRSLGVGGAGTALLPFVRGRGLEAFGAGDLFAASPVDAAGSLIPEIRLDSNENPYGPAAEALRAMTAEFGESNRYPDGHLQRLVAALSKHYQVPPDHLMLGSGSGETLKVAVEVFVTKERKLVTAAPTFELPAQRARSLGLPMAEVPVDKGLRLDLGGMADASAGAGLVFLCNPNNPTGTVHGAAAIRGVIDRILKASPETIILVDEAYHEYVDDPAYASMIPLALEEPRVIVSRTFSKVHGMAGLRLGFAVGRPTTLRKLWPHLVQNNVNVLVAAAAAASLSAPGHVEREVARNAEGRRFTREFFEKAGYAVVPSAANFLMVDIRRDMRPFREACRKQGVITGRPFPPLTNYARVSIGTMDEMKAATNVFASTLATGAGD